MWTVFSKYALQSFAAASGDLAILADGMHYGWSSPSLPRLMNSTDNSSLLTDVDSTWLPTMPTIGAMFGSITAALVIDILGRKNIILFTAVPFFVGWIMIAFAGSTIQLYYVARLIAGFADGATFTAVPMYIGEMASPNIRGFLGSSCSFSWVLGFLVINSLGSYLSIQNTALVSATCPVLLFFTFIWMPESPYYLLMRNKPDEARRSLQKFNRNSNVEDDLKRISEAVEVQNKNTGKFFDLFSVKSNRKAVIIIAALRGFQQFSGTTVFTFYTQEIFEDTGSNISASVASIIYCAIQLLFTIVSSIIVDKAGRKPLLIISMSGTFVCLVTEAIYFYLKEHTSVSVDSFSLFPVVNMYFYILIFSLGMQSIPVLMLGELFPTNVKAFALSLADIYYSIIVTLASYFARTLDHYYGSFAPFLGFAIFSLFGLLFIIFYIPETKDKTLEEIQEYLKHGKSRISENPDINAAEKFEKTQDFDEKFA